MSRGCVLRSRRSLAVGAMACVIVAGCGAASDPSAATDISPPSPDTSLRDSTTPIASLTVATTPETTPPDALPASTPPTSSSPGQTEAPEPVPEGYREFVVDGVTVRVRTDLDALPEQATEIAYGGTLIDAGEGPMLCFGGVADSYPPQCDGPIVAFEMGDWATVEGYVAFGERTLRLAWPPGDGPLEVIDDRPYEPLIGWPYQPLKLPAACADIEEFVDVETLARYAAEHLDVTGTPAVVDGGRVGMLQVVEGAVAQVRADLSVGDAEPCLDPVRYSTQELMAAQQTIITGPAREALFVGSTASGNAMNRLEVDVLVADASTVRQLGQLVADPGMLVVFGTAEIVAGS